VTKGMKVLTIDRSIYQLLISRTGRAKKQLSCRPITAGYIDRSIDRMSTPSFHVSYASKVTHRWYMLSSQKCARNYLKASYTLAAIATGAPIGAAVTLAMGIPGAAPIAVAPVARARQKMLRTSRRAGFKLSVGVTRHAHLL
jgi:hypothetical protein